MTQAVRIGSRTRVVSAGRHRSTRPRTLHLLDLENLVAGQITAQSCRTVWAEYQRVLCVRWDDHVVVAVAARHAMTAFLALPGTVQCVVGSNGPDGADLALIGAVDVGWAATRFRQVVIASGDHIFAGLAGQITAAGLTVVQTGGASKTSAELYSVCQQHVGMTGTPVPDRSSGRRLGGAGSRGASVSGMSVAPATE